MSPDFRPSPAGAPRGSGLKTEGWIRIVRGMLTSYIEAAMRHAHYEMIDDPKPFFGSIPECPGVWASAATLEQCREELQSVLEDWIVLGLRFGHPIPGIDGIEVAADKLEPIDV
jgi:predicted RNase H-like HicB family nuclease